MTAPSALAVWAFAFAAAPSPQDASPPLSTRYDLGQARAVYTLPSRLREISGLAHVGGELLAHNDERGVVYRIAVGSGEVDGGFTLGRPAPADDFEGMTSAGDRLFMITSKGLLFEFRSTPAGEAAATRVTDTGLGGECEVEGLAYHAASRALLAACKTLAPQAPEVRIHRLPLEPGAGRPGPIRIPWSAFQAFGHEGPVNPSGIAVDASTGTLVLVAARQRLIFEVSPSGVLRDASRLARKAHEQPEGIAFGDDGLLYVADEGGGGRGRLTVYAPRAGAGGR